MVTTRGKKVDFKREHSTDDGSGDDTVDPPRKHVKRSRKLNDTAYVSGKSMNKQGKGRRGGRLRHLMNMPIDIFTEICSYLAPKDLRSLCLTTRRLREILMSKESKHIWRTVLAAETGLPECPIDLNEPKYVALLFGIHCFGCGSRFGSRVDYYHRVRYCPSCYQENMLRERDAVWDWLERQGPPRLLYTLSSIDHDGLFGTVRLSKQDDRPILRSAFNETLDRYAEIKNAPDNKDLLEAFEAELLVQRDLRRETADTMLMWAEEKAEDRAEELESIKEARYSNIRDRLVDLGWDERDMPMLKSDFRSLVYKSQPLTDRIWQNLLPKLLPLMELGKQDRLEQEKRSRKNRRRTTLSDHYDQLVLTLLPGCPRVMLLDAMSARDFLELPAVNALLEEDTADIEDSRWESVAEQVSPFALSKVEESVRRIARCLGCADSFVGGTAVDHINSMVASVSNVSSVAWCPECLDILRSPRIFTHLHHYRAHSLDIIDQIIENPLSKLLQEIAVQALHDCGLDPETKWADIEDSTTFVCARCDSMVARHGTFSSILSHYMEVQRWFTKALTANVLLMSGMAPDHSPSPEGLLLNDHALDDGSPVMDLLDEEGLEIVLEAQAGFAHLERLDMRNDRLSEGGDDFQRDFIGRRILRDCKLCPEGFSPLADTVGWLELHVRDKHGIQAFDVEQHTERHISTFNWLTDWQRTPCPR